MTPGFLDTAVVAAHASAKAGDGDALLDALSRAGEGRTAAWLSLWWLAAREQSLVAQRALAFGVATASRAGDIDDIVEGCRIWLLADERSTADVSVAVTLLSGLEFTADEDAFPACSVSSTVPFLRSLVGHVDVNVFVAVLDFLRHMRTTGALQMLVNRSGAESLHAELLERRAGLPAAEDLSTDLGFLLDSQLPDNAPQRHRDLVRLALNVMDAVEAAGFPDAEASQLVTSVRRRALFDEAIAQAISTGSAVQTVRLIGTDPSVGLLRAVVGFGEAVVRERRAPDASEQDVPDFGLQFRPAFAASYPIHITYAEDDAKEVFDVLSRVLTAARKEKSLGVFLEQIPQPLLEASLRLLRSLVNANAALEVTLSQPALAEWQVTTLGRVERLSPTVLNRLAKRMREELRGRQVWIERADVPQANTVGLVFKVVELLVHQGRVQEADFDELNSRRQVNYYLHGARVLGLLDEDNLPTARAHAVIGLNMNEEMKLGAIYFEDSTVGTAWRAWAGVDRLSDLDPDTAGEFLAACVVGLSGSTPKRRASTLKKWLEDLKPFHYAVSRAKD